MEIDYGTDGLPCGVWDVQHYLVKRGRVTRTDWDRDVSAGYVERVVDGLRRSRRRTAALLATCRSQPGRVIAAGSPEAMAAVRARVGA